MVAKSVHFPEKTRKKYLDIMTFSFIKIQKNSDCLRIRGFQKFFSELLSNLRR